MSADTGREACPTCADLLRSRDEAKAARDLSTVTDCNVLLARHPEHGDEPVVLETAAGVSRGVDA
ncbi:hypothetical protein SALBM311S_08213 [Streptomyces alboniger]